jgi:hypothetical protein
VAMNRGGVNVPVSATWNGRALKQAETQLGGFKKSFGKAFLGFGAAAGAALGVGALGRAIADMAGNAAADQKSVATLGKTLSNLGLQASQSGVEDFVRTLSLQTGVVDDELRPAFDRLVRSTGDVGEAQRATVIALDAAKSSGRNVLDVAKLLGKAYDGNTMALGRAGLGIDSAILKSGDMVKITAELARLTGGQAAVAAETWAGKLERVNVAASEASETVGYQLLRAVDTVSTQLGGAGGFTEMITAAGDGVANFAAGLGDATVEAVGFGKAITGAIPGVDASETSFMDMLITVGKLTPGLGLVVTTTEGLVKTGQENIRVQTELNDELSRAALMRDIYSGSVTSSTSALEDDTTATKDNLTVKERLVRAVSTLNDLNRSSISTNIRLRELRAEGPQSTGGKNGKQVTKDDRRRFGLDYAEAVSTKAELLISQGKMKAAASVLSQGRDYLGQQVSEGFAKRVLATPRGLRDEIDRRDSVRGAEKWQQTAAPIYNTFNIRVEAKTAAETAAMVQRLARLRALEARGGGATGRGEIDWEAVARAEANR